jgi:hypothetical protein
MAVQVTGHILDHPCRLQIEGPTNMDIAVRYVKVTILLLYVSCAPMLLIGVQQLEP